MPEPKPKPTSGRNAGPNPSRPQESEDKSPDPVRRHERVDSILDFHSLGLRVIASQKRDGCSRERAAKRVSVEEVSNFETAKKAADFAAENPAGVPDWLRKLFGGADGRPIRVLHVRRVLGVKTEQQREWLERAYRKGWAASKLRCEIRKAAGVGLVRKGKPFSPLADLDETLDDIMTRGGEWLTRYKSVLPSEASWRPGDGLGPQEIVAMRKRITEASKLLEQLTMEAEHLRTQLAKARKRLVSSPARQRSTKATGRKNE